MLELIQRYETRMGGTAFTSRAGEATLSETNQIRLKFCLILAISCTTPICREGCIEIVQYFLNSFPDVWNCVSKNGRTPLHTTGESFFKLDSRTSDTRAATKHSGSLHLPDWTVALSLWGHKSRPVSNRVSFAALHGCLEVTDLLLERSSYQPDMKDSCGTTPLMDALRAGHTEIAQLLIHKHAVNNFLCHTYTFWWMPLNMGGAIVLSSAPEYWATFSSHFTVPSVFELAAPRDTAPCLGTCPQLTTHAFRKVPGHCFCCRLGQDHAPPPRTQHNSSLPNRHYGPMNLSAARPRRW